MIRASICMATRNKGEYLARTLASIRQQKVAFDYEILVADDGSTDSTAAVCDEYGAIRIYLPNIRYRNPSKARNAAYRAARGEIVIAQSDDVMHRSPDTLESLVKQLRPQRAVLARVLNMRYVKDTDNWVRCDDPFHIYAGPDRPQKFFFLGAIWRRDIYAIGGNDEEFVDPCWDDNWFGDMLTKGHKVEIVPLEYPLAYHQKHDHPVDSHLKEPRSRNLYDNKATEAKRTGRWINSGGPWEWRKEMGCIPKRMSFFWGGRGLSFMRYLTLKSFRHWNPDWDIDLYRLTECCPPHWKSHEQEDATGENDYTERLGELRVRVHDWVPPFPELSATHASDLAEWEILATVGGFYSDMDVLYVAPLRCYESLKTADAVFCLSGGWMTIGFFGASPDNPVFKAILQSARENYHPDRYQCAGAEAAYRMASCFPDWPNIPSPGSQTVRWARNTFPQLTVTEIPAKTIYPFDWTQVKDIFEQNKPLPDWTIGLHWFGANPLSQDWNRRITDRSWPKYHNTFTEALRRVFP